MNDHFWPTPITQFKVPLRRGVHQPGGWAFSIRPEDQVLITNEGCETLITPPSLRYGIYGTISLTAAGEKCPGVPEYAGPVVDVVVHQKTVQGPC